MKYIRTKDSVQELGIDEELKKRGTANYYYYKYKNIKMLMDKNDVKKYKQANTIEELCDEIVEIIDDKAQVVYADISFNDLAIAKIRDKNNATVYGAIWTDKGLIYVAKMNEKGELELL